MAKISVTVIVLNEEENIRDCMESLRWADEVIVSDSGSTDATVDICKGYGARVYSDDWLGFGRQKNLCAERAANDWILNVDADERVTPELKEEILRAAGSGRAAGYFIPRKNYFGKKWIRHCGWYPDYNLRLYRKDAGRFVERGVHESVTMDGAKGGVPPKGEKPQLGYLKGQLIHKTYRDVSDYLVRMERYSTLAATEMMKEGKSAGVTDVLLRPPFTFFKMFILKLGFLEGVAGIVLSTLYAAYTLAKYAKLWEMGRGKRIVGDSK